jgi:DNA-binding NtrC family response regulator
MHAHRDGSHSRIVGDSERTRQILRLVSKVGRGRWPVLVLGETGTGKEVVARAIHNVEPTGPFVTVDCSALVGPLMESELFGHLRGAFTGAVANKTGLIELANGGTAFLDEIGELPLDLQAKLLRVLQEKEFRPVGALTPKRVDFRVIAATNRDLVQEVERGNFRRDLYYRLNVVNLRLAPLRERQDDIPPLIEHFLSRYAGEHRFTQEAMDALMAYPWPGNVRELENCIQRIVAITTGPLVHVADLPSPVRNFMAARNAGRMTMAAAAGGAPQWAAAPARPGNGAAEIPLDRRLEDPSVLPLREVERRAILQALEFTKGDRALAANLLDIGRTTLYRKLREYERAS